MESDKNAIIACLSELSKEVSPFPAEIRFQFLDIKDGVNTEKLGTYGVIKNAPAFIGVTVKKTETAMEASGYLFEKFILYATSIGLGTCWLAGTFKREQFKNALSIDQDELFPIVCPIGYPADKKSLTEKIFRSVGKSDQRKNFDELFFENNFATPLSENTDKEYKFPLEMLRLAPSAANLQPWRIVYKNDAYHFFRKENPKSKYAYDLQRLDVGIGACHFHLAAQEKALCGKFEILPDVDIVAPDDVKYLFSWIKNKE